MFLQNAWHGKTLILARISGNTAVAKAKSKSTYFPCGWPKVIFLPLPSDLQPGPPVQIDASLLCPSQQLPAC